MPGCALRYCRNTSKNTAKSSGVTFHRFPQNPNGHKEEWVQFVRADRSEPNWSPTEHTYLCSAHFRENDFIYTLTGRKFTKLSAVPTIPSEFYQNIPGSSSTGDVSIEIEDETEDNDKSDGRNDAMEGNVPPAVGGSRGDVSMETEDGTEDKDKSDGSNVAMEDNVRRVVGGPRVAPGYGLILEAATVQRVVCTECSVFGCRNNVRANPDKRFFPFPTNQERCSTWLTLINRKDLATKLKPNSAHRVCSDHFDGFDYHCTNTLKDTAVPQYKLPVRSVPITYDNDESAGPSGWQEKPIKTEAVDTMEIEIQLESNEQVPINNTHIKQEPPSLNTVEAPCLAISDPFSLATKPQKTLSRKERFLQRATISPVEHIYLPGSLTDFLLKFKNQNTVQVQTTKILLDHLNAPLKKQHETELREIKKYIKVWETKRQRYMRSPMAKKEFQQYCDMFLDDKFSTLVKFHVTMASKACGNRYSSDFKTLALNLYFSSPRSYNFVEKLFHLPSRATTIRTQMPIRTGINALFIEYFKAKVDKMSAKEKMCSVYFDHIKLSKNLHYCVNNDFLYGLHDIDQVIGTEPAGYATLIMVKGLYSEWQQPISFAYVTEKTFYTELKEWLYKIIALLFEIGLNVKALIMSLGTKFLEFPEVSIAEPYFEVFGRKVYQIFDVPDLFKRARDTLMEYDFHIGSKCVKWSHITKVYNHDKKQKLRLVPKLTDAHVRPEEDEDGAELAIQVFSRTVAAAMNYHVIAKLIKASASDTIEFIQTMNNLFDILNSQKMSHENEFKRAYTNTEQQKKFLTNTFEYLKQLEIKDKRGNPVDDDGTSFVTGLLITMKSIASLFEDLQRDNFNYLLTKHFSLECMKIYFNKVRDLGGNCCTTPTPIMFARSFRRLFLVSLVSNTKGESEMDLKTTLTKISEYVKVNDNAKEETEPSHNRFLKIVGGDCLKLWPKPGPTFLGGFFLSKCLEKHYCCQKFLESLCSQYNVEVSDAETLLNKFKQYNPKNLNKTDLLPPPQFIVDATLRMDQIFEDYIQRDDKDMYNFGWNVYLKMESEVFELPCKCFPLMYLKQLCIRTKVFHLTRHYNSNIKPPRRFRLVSKKRKGK